MTPFATTRVKLSLQARFSSVPPRSPHEFRPRHAFNIVPKGTNVDPMQLQ